MICQQGNLLPDALVGNVKAIMMPVANITGYWGFTDPIRF